MSMSAPAPPNPYEVAIGQSFLNQQAAQTQGEMNMVNQSTPYGTLNYTQIGNYPDGTPKFGATQQYTPAVNNLFNTMLGTQQEIGTTANQLISNLGPSLTQPPKLDPTSTTRNMMNWFNQYEMPIWDQQRSNLQSQLAAQGIAQGTTAYNNAENLQARNIGDAGNQFLTMAEPLAFNQALASYQAPIATLGTLLGESSPQSSVNSSLTSTPSESIQPANLTGDIYSSYQSQLGNYENTMQGLFSIPAAVLGGFARIGLPSDIRIKENISRVGTLTNGLPIYIFNYIKDVDGIPQIGLMAQDVEKINPDAVYEINGVKHVDYKKAVQ